VKQLSNILKLSSGKTVVILIKWMRQTGDLRAVVFKVLIGDEFRLLRLALKLMRRRLPRR
jgi:hypothetical protein